MQILNNKNINRQFDAGFWCETVEEYFFSN